MSGAPLSNLNPGRVIKEIKEGSLLFNFLINRRAGLIKLWPASFFYKLLTRASYGPDLGNGSIFITSFIRPGHLWFNSRLSLPKFLPHLAAVLFILISVIYNPIIFYTHLAKFRLGLMLMPILLILGLWRSGEDFPGKTIFDLPLFFLFLIAVISMRTIENIYSLALGLREFMALGVFIVSIYLIIYLFKKSEIKRLFYFLGLAGLLASVLFLLSRLFFKNSEIYLKNTFGNPNHLAYFLALVYPLVLINLAKSSSGKWLWWLGAILLPLALFFTYSLGGWFSFSLSILLLCLFLKKEKRLSLILAAGGIALLAFPFIRHKFLEGLSLSYGSTIMARMEIWKAALSAVYHKPILGLGLGQFAASAKPYYAKEMYNAFSVFFHLAATTGLLGLAFFLWFLVRAFKLNLRVRQHEPLYGAAILASLSGGIMGFLWDTHLLAVMTNWLLGFLWGSLVVMDTREGEQI